MILKVNLAAGGGRLQQGVEYLIACSWSWVGALLRRRVIIDHVTILLRVNLKKHPRRHTKRRRYSL